MKNKIGIFLFIALLIAHQSISFAKEKKLYIPTKSVPLELRYLINTLQATKLKDSDSLKLDQQIHSLKKSLPLLATADFFTITKAEIYKSVISLSTDAGRSSAVNVFSIPEYISKLNALDTKRYGQFSAWLINSVKSKNYNSNI